MRSKCRLQQAWYSFVPRFEAEVSIVPSRAYSSSATVLATQYTVCVFISTFSIIKMRMISMC